MKKHSYLIITIILGLIAIVFLCWLSWQINKEYQSFTWQNLLIKPKPIVYEELKTEMDTSGWLEYKNDDWGLKFKYPRDQEVRKMLGELAIRPKNCPEFYTGYDNDHTWGAAIVIYYPILLSETTLPDSVLNDIKTEEGRVDYYKKNYNYQIHKVSYNNDNKSMVIAMILYEDKVLEARTSGQCLAVVDEPKFIDAILTTLKFYD